MAEITTTHFTLGSCEVDQTIKRSYIRMVDQHGKVFYQPYTQATVAIEVGDGLVVYKMTLTKKAKTFTRMLDLPPDRVRNQAATGPAYVDKIQALPMKAEAVMAAVARVCGVSVAEAEEVFS
jgi:hypothetical protein